MGVAQKPSSARLTQLKANKPQAPTATEAKVVINLVTGMTHLYSKQRMHCVLRCQRKDGEKMLAPNNRPLW
jgi:hypothetical protein